MMLPAPITIAISRPLRWTSTISSARTEICSGSTPWSRSPIRASPDSFRRTRLNAGELAGRCSACALADVTGSLRDGQALELDHLEAPLGQRLTHRLRRVV